MSGRDAYPGPSGTQGDQRPWDVAFNGMAIPPTMMPMELHVFLRDAALPTREGWQAGITDQGFELTLDATLDVRHHAGFSPAVCWGKKSGFELDFRPAIDIASRYNGVSERIGARNLAVSFRWRGNFQESVIVYITSAVLARLADGILYYPQKNNYSTGYEALAVVRRLMEVTEWD
jgi:hypothetical protein